MLLAIVKDTHVEAPEEFSKKATPFFAHVADKFYAKVNDDIYLNIDVLGAALATHLEKPCIYIGCMQSGEVFSELYGSNWRTFSFKWGLERCPLITMSRAAGNGQLTILRRCKVSGHCMI